MRPTRDQTMMKIAYVIADRSTCRRRSVGAVAVDALGRVLSVGHNGVPMGHPHCVEAGVGCPGTHYTSGHGLDKCEATHAESNCLMFCPDVMKIDTIYVTTSPCVACVKSLLNTSAKRIVYAETYDEGSLYWWRSLGRIAEKIDG